MRDGPRRLRLRAELPKPAYASKPMANELSPLASPKCGHCGARLDLPPGSLSVVCQFCGTRYDAPRMSAPGYAPPQKLAPGQVLVTAFGARGPGQVASRIAYQAPARGLKAWMAVLYVIPVVLVVGISSVVSIATSANRSRALAASKVLGAKSNGLAALGQRITMDTWADPPAVAQVNADGKEDIVGRYTVYEDGKTRLYVGAFDGVTFERIWAIGPLAEAGAESSATHVAVAGRNVFVADSRATLHVYDLATGGETKAVKLTDRAEQIFAAPNASGDAWLKMSDKKDVSYDGKAGSLKPSTAPAWMPEKLKFPDSFDCEMHFRNPGAHARCIPKKAVPAVPTFEAQNGLVEGDDAVAFGTKSPGTRTPMLAGFDAKTKKLRWSVPVSGDALGVQEGAPKVGDLVGGRVVVAYATSGGDGRIAAFDVKTGHRLWEAAAPKTTIGVLTMTPTRVYVPASPVIRVYDAQLGRLLGSIGTSN